MFSASGRGNRGFRVRTARTGVPFQLRPTRLAVGQGVKVPRSTVADLSPEAGLRRPIGSPVPAGGARLGYTWVRIIKRRRGLARRTGRVNACTLLVPTRSEATRRRFLLLSSADLSFDEDAAV